MTPSQREKWFQSAFRDMKRPGVTVNALPHIGPHYVPPFKAHPEQPQRLYVCPGGGGRG